LLASFIGVLTLFGKAKNPNKGAKQNLSSFGALTKDDKETAFRNKEQKCFEKADNIQLVFFRYLRQKKVLL
jgi:hypothetical protein